MSEAKHTQGPWRYVHAPGYCGELIAQDGTTIAEFVVEPSLANARLIAAAPELLAALLVAHKRITEDRASYVWGAELPDGSMDDKDAAILHKYYDSKLAQIEAAIAKATGGAA